MATTTMQMSILIGAALAGSFSGTFNKAGTTLEKLQGKLSALDKNQAAIEKFGKLQNTLNQTSDKLNAARGRVRDLGEQMRATANPSEQLKRQFLAAHQEAARLENKLGDQRKGLGQLRNSLSAAGVDTKNFSDEQARLAQNTQLAAQAEKMRQAEDRVIAAQGNLDAQNKDCPT